MRSTPSSKSGSSGLLSHRPHDRVGGGGEPFGGGRDQAGEWGTGHGQRDGAAHKAAGLPESGVSASEMVDVGEAVVGGGGEDGFGGEFGGPERQAHALPPNGLQGGGGVAKGDDPG